MLGLYRKKTLPDLSRSAPQTNRVPVSADPIFIVNEHSNLSETAGNPPRFGCMTTVVKLEES